MRKDELEYALESYPTRLQLAYERLAVVRQKQLNYELLKVEYEFACAAFEVRLRLNPPDGIKLTESAIEALVKGDEELFQMARDLAEVEHTRKVPTLEEMEAEIALKVLREEFETLKLIAVLSLDE